MRVLKVSVHMNHLSVIGTEKHVGQRINRLPCCAEYSLSDTNRKKKIILRILAAVEILISSLSLALSPSIQIYLFSIPPSSPFFHLSEF